MSVYDQPSDAMPASPADTSLCYRLAAFLFQPNQLMNDTCHSSCCLHVSGLCIGRSSRLEHCLPLFTVRTFASAPPSICSLHRCVLCTRSYLTFSGYRDEENLALLELIGQVHGLCRAPSALPDVPPAGGAFSWTVLPNRAAWSHLPACGSVSTISRELLGGWATSFSSPHSQHLTSTKFMHLVLRAGMRYGKDRDASETER